MRQEYAAYWIQPTSKISLAFTVTYVCTQPEREHGATVVPETTKSLMTWTNLY
jgi:hypothetical protein